MDSMLCTKRALVSDEFLYWGRLLKHNGGLHRKIWEWCFIAQALREHGVLVPGKKGLGFGVGEEPLASLFASAGASILATDLNPQDVSAMGWIKTSQHASNKSKLNKRGICVEHEFERLVTFEFGDMNAIPERYHQQFDFVWSSCALEHLGSIELGEKFILKSIDCLRPGGVAVHTTEFNVSSDSGTIESGPTVLFRKKDINKIIGDIAHLGSHIRMDWNCGDQPEDYFVDVPPYLHNPHLKLRIGNYVATSIGLVIVK